MYKDHLDDRCQRHHVITNLGIEGTKHAHFEMQIVIYRIIVLLTQEIDVVLGVFGNGEKDLVPIL
jgi:hypothetical protein